MSGHSKWSTIHRQKEINDQKRGQIFTKIANAITLAVKEMGGSGEPSTNFKLRLAIEKARSVNMPNDKIQKAIERGQGRGEGVDLVETVYEGYATGGVGVLVETLSDNRQRTVQEIKNIFDRAGGSIVSPGSVAYNFKTTGIIEVETTASTKESAVLALIDLGVDDIEESSDGPTIVVYTQPEEMETVKDKLVSSGWQITSAELGKKPISQVNISSVKEADQLADLIAKLEDLEDVQRVFTNAKVIDSSPS